MPFPRPMSWTLLPLALAAAGMVQAATSTATLGVSATVAASGTVGASPLNLGTAGGSLNVGTGGNGSAELTVAFTLGVPFTVRLGQGGNPDASSSAAAPRRRMAGNGAYLEYDLYQDAAGTIPWGNTTTTAKSLTGTGAPVPVQVHAVVRPGQLVPAGTYTDTIQVSVDY